MKQVEFFLWMLPPDPWRKKPSPSRWKMSREDAAAKYPGATPILSSREVREIAEPGDVLVSAVCPPMPGSDGWKKLHPE